MIIFDTNALRGFTRANPRFDILRALKRSGVHTVGVPWMVLEELVARQTLEYADSHKRATIAVNQLRRWSPWSNSAQIPPLDFEKARQYWRDQYTEVLEVVETSGEAAKEALTREAYCEKPAKTNPEEKGGARDAAIWLSIVEYLKAHADDEVLFVSNNPADFGDGNHYSDLMSRDLGDMRERLTILKSFDDVISRFTQKIEVNAEDVKSSLESVVNSVPIVEASTVTSMRGGRFEGTLLDNNWETSSLNWRVWLLTPTAVVHSVANGSAHKIGDAEWYTATVDWILVGLASLAAISYFERSLIRPEDTSAVTQLACQWRTKVLFSVGENPELAIVESDTPRALNVNDRDTLQPLIERGLNGSDETTSPAMSVVVSQLIDDPAWVAMFNVLLTAVDEHYGTLPPG